MIVVIELVFSSMQYSWRVLNNETGVGVIEQRRVSLFRDGHSQAVTIPREFELPGTKALMRKAGTRLIIEPLTFAGDQLIALLETLTALDENFPEVEDLPLRARE